MRLKSSRGRFKTQGIGNAQAKLSEERIREIRFMWKHRESLPVVTMRWLATQMDVSHSQIYRIVHNIDWKHIK